MLRILVALSFLAASIAASADAGDVPKPKVGYQADVLTKVDTPGGSLEFPGHVWQMPDRERREHTIMGRKSVVIRRDDRNVTWLLMPEQKTFIENPDEGKDPSASAGWDADQDVTLEKEGTETVNGYETTRYRVTSASKSGGATTEGKLWMTDDWIPVQMKGTNTGEGGPTEFHVSVTNIDVGVQDPELFELPKGYARLTMPSFPMGGGEAPDPEAMKKLQESLRRSLEQMQKQGAEGH